MSGSIGSGKALRPEGPMSPPGAAGRVVRPLAGRSRPAMRGAFGLVSGSGGRGVHRLAEQAPVPAVLGCGERSGAGLFRDGMAEQRAVHGGGTDQEILSGTPPEGGVGSASGVAGPRTGHQVEVPGCALQLGRASVRVVFGSDGMSVLPSPAAGSTGLGPRTAQVRPLAREMLSVNTQRTRRPRWVC